MISDYGRINENAPHLVADLCEIMAFFEGREVSRSDIEARLQSSDYQGLLDDMDIKDLGSAEANERLQAFSEEVFRHLSYRQVAFGDWYPFEIEGDILLNREDGGAKSKVYAALLAYSRLKMFSHSDRTLYAAQFETLCKEAAAGFAPGWEVLHFGTGGEDRDGFGTKLKDALANLADYIKEHPVTQEINKLPDNNTGDAGIDLVIIKQWSDHERGKPVYFAQCAARKDHWPTKRFEAHAVNLKQYFNFSQEVGSLLFIPVCYRSTDGQWIDSSGYGALIVDRLRLVNLLDSQIDEDDEEAILSRIDTPFSLGCAASSSL